MKPLSLLLSVSGGPGTVLRYLPLGNSGARRINISCQHVLQTRSFSHSYGRVLYLKGNVPGRRYEKDHEPLVLLMRRKSTSAQQASATGSDPKADDREFDIVLFGATGLAGRYCIEQLHFASRENIKWAIAGRNRTKLTEALKEVSTWVEKDLSNAPVIEADLDKPESLAEMAKKTRCIINTVGPYTLNGEKMIKACLAKGTHMLDLSGELHYNEAMRNKYHHEAKEKGVIFLQTCGFGSVPSEFLLLYAKENFPGHLNTFETFLTFREGEHGSTGNTGTLKSLIQISSNITGMPAIRAEAWKTVFKQPWQDVKFRKRLWLTILTQDGIPGLTIPLVGTDKPAMNHSEFFRREMDPSYQRTQVQNRFYDESAKQIMRLTTVPFALGALSQFSAGQDLLQKFPSLFSLGLFREGGPSRLQVLTCGFTMFGIGEGWLKGEPRDRKPKHQITVRVDGPECGYRTTSICLVQSAICLVRETDRVPMKGGYLTPGFALERTSLPERIRERGLEYKIVKKKEYSSLV